MSATGKKSMNIDGHFLRLSAGRTLLAAILLLGTAMAGAQTFPSKPTRLIIAFPAGGPVDLLGRLMAPRLTESMGQQMIVENRPGANGNIGADQVARAPADGHTAMLVVSSFATNHHLYAKLPFHPLRDFAPVTLLTAAPLIIVSHPSLPVRSIKELIALARARPGQLNVSVAGAGSGGQLTTELFKSLAKVDMLAVPYKGGAAAIVDAISGEVQLTLNSALALLPHMKAGKLRALGVTSQQRVDLLPELPTVAEAGLPGFESSLWYGIVLPVKTPPALVARLNTEYVRAIQLPEIRDRLVGDGMRVFGSTPEQFADHLRTESEKWGKVIREAKIRLD